MTPGSGRNCLPTVAFSLQQLVEHFQPYEEIAATASKWSVQYIMFNASLEHCEILTMEIIKTSKNAFFQKTKVTLA